MVQPPRRILQRLFYRQFKWHPLLAFGGNQRSEGWDRIRTNNDSPIIRRQPRDVTAPTNTAANLTVAATAGTNQIFYQWQKQQQTNWLDVSGKTNYALTFASLQDSDEGIYRARASTAQGFVAFSLGALVQTIHAPIIS